MPWEVKCKQISLCVCACVRLIERKWDLPPCTCAGCRAVAERMVVCEQRRRTLCEWVHKCVILSLRRRWNKWRGNGCRNSCASRGKHIGQLRPRLCTALLCVGLIESERQQLTALCLRTLQVITHKSLFPCIGSSAQLRPHKQSTSASFITSGCLLTFSGTQSNRQFSCITLSRGCFTLSLGGSLTDLEPCIDIKRKMLCGTEKYLRWSSWRWHICLWNFNPMPF